MLKTAKIKKILTDEGVMFPIYKDWDKWHGGYDPKMVYITTIDPRMMKGPILHKKRRGLITAIQGNVLLEYKTPEGTYGQIKLCTRYGSTIVEIPAGMPFSLSNSDNMVSAIVINCPDRAWHPDDEDTYKFDSWEDVP